MKSKKSKDGGSGAWYDGSVYALKGGNTCQFFLYDVTGDTWGELDTMPSFGSTAKKKKVKAGGDIASFGNGVFFALKGNKTNEFWRYVIPADSRQPTTDSRSGVQTKSSTIYDLRMTVSPNPIANGYATIRLSGPAVRWSSGQVRIFDAAGRCVMGRSLVCRSSEFAVPLDLRNLANGVYLVRFDADGYTRSQKLVVQK